ncbi:hypothetical protein ABID70_000848 [Clavibacter michiganensis]|uniref:toll/interleukin-1 receptor domain-containing protein n=1 Tax=Clavibacter michiganensis TaxID=28447 RepID=UPI001AE64362|nr:toll/interleukin-1 receptor domain-containing protein [Clavibacter michiganensis]MBP2458290.1 hypothetical protein [Clavibacter michiganensis]MDQ0410861.1 hypothetical protein [Clavibacter michiganensis]
MQVFISWSGTQAHAVALALHEWLPRVLARKVRPFVSSEDIDTGARGLVVIEEELQQSKYGVVVVTPLNLGSPWVNFEAGALGKSVGEKTRVAPLLVGLTDRDIDGPLSQFQMRVASDRDAVFKLVQSINRAHAEPTDDETIETLFDAHWASFEAKVHAALALDVSEPPRRDSADVLEEVLTTVRGLQREVSELRALSPRAASNKRAVHEISKNPVHRALEILIATVPNLPGEVIAGELGRTVTVKLPPNMPSLNPDIFQQFKLLASQTGFTMRLQRADGTWFAFDPDGQSSLGHDEPEDEDGPDE